MSISVRNFARKIDIKIALWSKKIGYMAIKLQSPLVKWASLPTIYLIVAIIQMTLHGICVQAIGIWFVKSTMKMATISLELSYQKWLNHCGGDSYTI